MGMEMHSLELKPNSGFSMKESFSAAEIILLAVVAVVCTTVGYLILRGNGQTMTDNNEGTE